MKQILRTLCAVGALIYAGDVSAMDIVGESSATRGNGFRNIQEFNSFSPVPEIFDKRLIQEFRVNDGADIINGVPIIVNGVPVIVDYIDKEAAPGKGVTHKPGEEEWYGISYHYSAGGRYSGLRDGCYMRGMGWHFNILQDGTITQFVPLGDVTFSAGAHSENRASLWNGYTNLNNHHIFIMMFNDGWSKTDDGRIVWPEYTKEQVDAAKKLVNVLVEEYEISPFNVIASSDGSMGRYPGPGPMFPFEEVFPFYLTEKKFDISEFSEFDEEDHIALLKIVGYNNNGGNGKEFKCSYGTYVETFCMHYISSKAKKNYSEHEGFTEADLKEIKSDFPRMLFSLIASRYNYMDSKGWYDKKFREDVNSFIEKREYAKPLADLIQNWNELESVE